MIQKKFIYIYLCWNLIFFSFINIDSKIIVAAVFVFNVSKFYIIKYKYLTLRRKKNRMTFIHYFNEEKNNIK